MSQTRRRYVAQPFEGCQRSVGTEIVKLVHGDTLLSEIEADARAASSTGLEPPFAGALAYLAGPFSGVVILMAERTNRFVRFHAWQAIIGLGGLGLLAILLLLFAFLGLFLSPTVFRTLYVLAGIAALAWLAAWIFCVVKAFGGSAFKLPLAGNYAERKASAPDLTVGPT